MLDVLHHRNTGKAGAHHRRVGDWRHLVAEERAADDRADHQTDVHVHAHADRDHGQTDRRDCAPGRASEQGGHRAKDQNERQEHLWVDDVKAVVDQRRHRAGRDPRGGHAADDKQNDRWLNAGADRVDGGFFNIFIAVSEVIAHADRGQPCDKEHQAQVNAQAGNPDDRDTLCADDNQQEQDDNGANGKGSTGGFDFTIFLFFCHFFKH